MKLIYKVLVIVCILALSGCSTHLTEERSMQDETVTIESSDSEEASTERETAQTESVSEQPTPTPEPEDDEFVKVADYIPDVVVELRYATENNFTGQQIYEFADVWLRYGTVKKLALVQEELKKAGLYLKIWDGFRPPSAQFKLWEVCPDATYVSDPNKGFSSHSRGNTVDVTLVYEDGTEVVMPTDFDDFSDLADRDYGDCSKEAADNALLLEQTMKACGFSAYYNEWWHFSDTDKYEVEEVFLPE